MIKRSTSVPRGTAKNVSLQPEEHYGNVLEAFDKYDRSQSTPIVSKRATGGLLRKEKARLISPASITSSEKTAESPSQAKHQASKSTKHSRKSSRTSTSSFIPTSSLIGTPTSRKSVLGNSNKSKSTAATSSLTDDSPGDKSLRERNEALETENRRLKRILRARELHASKQEGGEDAKEGNGEEGEHVETDVRKLHGKIRSLKTKCKAERGKTMQLGKSIEAHQTEIEGLRRELDKALEQVESFEREQESDRDRLVKLTDELEKWRDQGENSPKVKKLEKELRERNDELEVTLELLEKKVEKILQLEKELHQTQTRLRLAQDANARGYGTPQTSVGSASLSTELRESQAECKKLKRQNMMLRLLFEELEANSKGEGGGDLDSVFQKVASDRGVPLEVGEESMNMSSKSDERHFLPYIDNLSPVSVMQSIEFLPPSSTSSSVEAENLFQKEIERCNLDTSSSSYSPSRQSPCNFADF